VSVIALVLIGVLVFRAGDLFAVARDYIQDRLAEPRSALQQN